MAVASAADLPTKKAAPAAAKPNCYASFWTWLDSTAADCPLTAAGFTLYGAVDMGVGYQSSGSKFNRNAPNGINEIISKQNNGGVFQLVPNGIAQSNVGIKMKEQVAPNWFIVGDVNAGFDPYSLSFSNGPQSLIDNNGVALQNQSTNGDSSRTYNLINSRAFIGVSNPTFGTLTVGRHYTFSNDNSSAYDPFGGAYAFSLIGFSGSSWAGNGVTEIARYNTSVKYKVEYNGFRGGAIVMFGGWGNGNGAKTAYQFDIGGDWNGLSVDATYGHATDSVNLGTQAVGNANVVAQRLTATLADVDAFTLNAKYKWQALTVYGGYEHSNISNPSDQPGLAGTIIGPLNGGMTGVVAANAYPNTKTLQLAYVGAKYGIRPDLDVATGFYHMWQNNYNNAACTANAAAAIPGASPQGASSGKCDGTTDVVSAMIDYRPVKRLDVYAGVAYSVVAGGMANGFIKSVEIAPTAGLKFSF